MDSFRRKEMIYNNYPDDYIVINAKWVEWDNDEQRWCFMTEDAFEKAQSLSDHDNQVRKEVVEDIKERLKKANLEIMSPIDLYSYTDNFLYYAKIVLKN